jgi:hypothetical protein
VPVITPADVARGRYGRNITRVALSDERVQINDAGQVELKLMTPWREGTMHLVMPRWSSCTGRQRLCRGRDCTRQ